MILLIQLFCLMWILLINIKFSHPLDVCSINKKVYKEEFWMAEGEVMEAVF